MIHRRAFAVGALVAVALLGAALAVACDDEGARTAPIEGTPANAGTPPAAETAVAPTAAPGPGTFRVLAGVTEGAIDVEQFMPATIRIRAGDTITWTAAGYEGHTVTFIPDGLIEPFGPYLAPAPDRPEALEFNPAFVLASEAQGTYDGTRYTNSGIMGVPAPAEYSLTFSEPGTYAYLCMIHPLHMRGVVVVEEEGAAVPAPEAVNAGAEALRERYVEEALSAQREVDERLRSAGSSGAHQVAVGIDTPASQVLSFLPASLEVEAGDKVVFWNSERDFHNVIFAPEGVEAPQFPIILPNPSGGGGFRLLINPDAAREMPPPEGFGPDDLFSSGLMGIFQPRLYWEVTFTEPGVYRYVCTVHTLAGMVGVITVSDSAAP